LLRRSSLRELETQPVAEVALLVGAAGELVRDLQRLRAKGRTRRKQHGRGGGEASDQCAAMLVHADSWLAMVRVVTHARTEGHPDFPKTGSALRVLHGVASFILAGAASR